MRDHTKLRAFELADEVAVLVYQVTTGFPREELYGLTSQMRRAAVSVPSNIVDSSLLEAKIVETEKVLNGLIQALRGD